jgi:hypothetical protein
VLKKIKKCTIAIFLISLFAFTIPSIDAQTLPMQDNGSISLPSGVTPDESYQTISHMSFRPNPIGVGQPLLVNLWLQPPLHLVRYFKNDYVVTLTKPDGTTYQIGPLSSYVGDATAWFEYTVDQEGTWQIKFDFTGAYFPAGIYNTTGSFQFGTNTTFTKSVYYKPSSDGPYNFTVSKDFALSWPGKPLPTDYWTRPASPESREWWPILGNYPGTGVVGGGPLWPADTNAYMSNYGYTPYVEAPKSAHVVWMRQDAISGLIGGTMGQISLSSSGGKPTIIYAGRAYQTITKMVNGNPTSVWQCYDIRTGEVFWEQTGVTQAPTMINYITRTSSTVPGEQASESGLSVRLMYVGSSRLIWYDPWLGTVIGNISISPFTSGIFYAQEPEGWPIFLTVQDLGAAAGNNRYRLINWTITGDVGFGGATNLRPSVLGNVSWPFSAIGTVDYEAGIAVSTLSITTPGTGGTGTGFVVAYGQAIMAASMTTGQLLFNVTTDTTTGLGGFFSGSTAVADHGKYAVRENDGNWHCWDLRTGKELWVSELSSWPWGTFGCYGVQSYGGNIISNQYDGVAAYNWTNGRLSWLYQYVPEFPYESPYSESATGTESYPWFTGTAVIADNVLYTYNTEHTPSNPIQRGLKMHAINITTGQGIWNISGCMAPGAIADGYLTAGNSYDGYMYVFGKGTSVTTVTAPDTVVQQGTGVLIRGTVLDLSPAQPNTPCVSVGSMATQMEYLHMQHPIDGVDHNASMTGVSVLLTAIDPNNNAVTIGTATTSGYYGTFEMPWTPPSEGTYKIIATFAGDDSYGSSSAATAVSVGAQATTSSSPAPALVVPDYTMTIVAGFVAIAIVVVVIGALIMMMIRKKA